MWLLPMPHKRLWVGLDFHVGKDMASQCMSSLICEVCKSFVPQSDVSHHQPPKANQTTPHYVLPSPITYPHQDGCLVKSTTIPKQYYAMAALVRMPTRMSAQCNIESIWNGAGMDLPLANEDISCCLPSQNEQRWTQIFLCWQEIQ